MCGVWSEAYKRQIVTWTREIDEGVARYDNNVPSKLPPHVSLGCRGCAQQVQQV